MKELRANTPENRATILMWGALGFLLEVRRLPDKHFVPVNFNNQQRQNYFESDPKSAALNVYRIKPE